MGNLHSADLMKSKPCVPLGRSAALLMLFKRPRRPGLLRFNLRFISTFLVLEEPRGPEGRAAVVWEEQREDRGRLLCDTGSPAPLRAAMETKTVSSARLALAALLRRGNGRR